MKFIKLFEEFKDTTAAQANDILKKIDKNLRYNLQYGTLHDNGFVYDQSDIYDDNGPYDWMKVEIHSEKEKDTYCWTLTFMMNEEFLSDEAKPGEEKIYIEFNKFKLPEYKKIASMKKSYPLKDVFEDKFLHDEMKKVEKVVLKVPKDKKEYDNNIKNQIDSLQTAEPSEGENVTAEPSI